MSTRERGERGDLNYVFHKVGKCGESKFKFEKILVENFLSVEPGSGHKGKNFSNFWKHVFFANWTIQNHQAKKKNLSKIFLVENFLSVEPGSGHKGKKFSNFWKHVFFANWTIQNRLAKKIFFREHSRRATRDRATGAIFELKYLRKLKRNRCPVFFCCSQSLFCTF